MAIGKWRLSRTDLKLGQNSKSKIQIFLNFYFFEFFPRFKSVPGSSISHYSLKLVFFRLNGKTVTLILFSKKGQPNIEKVPSSVPVFYLWEYS